MQGQSSRLTLESDFPIFYNATELEARKQAAIEQIITGMTFDEQLGVVGGGNAGVREQGYYLVSLLETSNQSLQNITRARIIIRNLHEKFQIKEKYRGARQYGGFLSELGMDLDDYDGNYANFMAPFLAHVGIHHSADLDDPTRSVLDTMLRLLASAVHAQDNRVDYTNMFLLRVYSLLLLGRYFNDDSMRLEARNQWDRWTTLVRAEGFPEHNSPNYGFVDLWALEGIYLESIDRTMQLQAKAMLEWFWMDWGQHFHLPSGYHTGTGARVKESDRYFGTGSHDNPLYLYFDAPGGLGSTSISRLFLCDGYVPPDYIKEVTIERQYPLYIKTLNYGADTYTYMVEDYSVATESGCKFPENAGSTASDVSGERLAALVTYQANSSRRSAVFDTSPHYQTINCIQHEGSAIMLVNFDVPANRACDEIHLQWWIGAKALLDGAQGEVRVDNQTWDGVARAFNDTTTLTVRANTTFIGIKPLPTMSPGSIKGVVANNTHPVLLAWANNVEAGTEDLLLRTYIHHDSGTDLAISSGVQATAGYIVEVASVNDGITFDEFTTRFSQSLVNQSAAAPARRDVTYASNRTGTVLHISEDWQTNRIRARDVNGVPYTTAYLLESNYTRVPRNPSWDDLRTLLRTDDGTGTGGLRDTDLDALPDSWETTFSALAGSSPGVFNATTITPGDDLDGDGLSNLVEFQRGSSPYLADFDLDGSCDAVDADPTTGVSFTSFQVPAIWMLLASAAVVAFCAIQAFSARISGDGKGWKGRSPTLAAVATCTIMGAIVLEILHVSVAYPLWIDATLSFLRLGGLCCAILAWKGARENPASGGHQRAAMRQHHDAVAVTIAIAGAIFACWSLFTGLATFSHWASWLLYVALFGEMILFGGTLLVLGTIKLAYSFRLKTEAKTSSVFVAALAVVGAVGFAVNPILTLTRSDISVIYTIVGGSALLAALLFVLVGGLRQVRGFQATRSQDNP